MNQPSQFLKKKIYKQHLDKLSTIINRNYLIKNNHTNDRKRAKTEAHTNQSKIFKDQIHIKQLNNPTLPVVLSKRNNKNKSINSVKNITKNRHISQKDSTILLQNYLLGQRLLQVKSSIKFKLFQKQFQKHEKYSYLRSRSKLQQLSFLNSRIVDLENKSIDKIKGHGRIKFIFEIKQLKTIFKQKLQQKIFNLIIKIGKDEHEYTHLSFKSLKQTRKIRTTKKQLKQPSIINFILNQIRGNQVIQFCQFQLDVFNIYQQIKNKKRQQTYLIQQFIIQNIRNSTQKKIGTIQLNVKISQ